MSLFKAAWFKLFFVLPLLAACGFTPVYGVDGTGTKLQNRVLVDEPLTREGYVLTRQIERRLGRAAGPAYALSVTIKTTEESLAIDVDGDIERYNLVGTADYVLLDKASGAIVASGQVQNFTGYSATGTTVATLAAQRDAADRLMIILADKIVSELLVKATL